MGAYKGGLESMPFLRYEPHFIDSKLQEDIVHSLQDSPMSYNGTF